jgi:hypothetical protein
VSAKKNEITLRKRREDRQARAHRLIYGQMSKQEQDAAYEERETRGADIRKMSVPVVANMLAELRQIPGNESRPYDDIFEDVIGIMMDLTPRRRFPRDFSGPLKATPTAPNIPLDYLRKRTVKYGKKAYRERLYRFLSEYFLVTDFDYLERHGVPSELAGEVVCAFPHWLANLKSKVNSDNAKRKSKKTS